MYRGLNGPMLAKPLKGEPKVGWVYEPKLDGVRIMVDKTGDKVQIYTRTFHDKTDNFPHLKEAFEKIDGDFILDGEIVESNGIATIFGQRVPKTDFSKVQGIVGSSVSKAVASQGHYKSSMVVFDCLKSKGVDLMGSPDFIRRAAADLMVQLLREHTHHVHLVARWDKVDKDKLYDAMIDIGGEGLMVKNPSAQYRESGRPSDTWYKIKAVETADVVIMGYTAGEGKYEGQVGAVEFGQYKNGIPTKRSKCSGMTDAVRLDITNHKDQYLGQVLVVKYFGRVGPEKSFRHPVWIGTRSDKRPEDCTWDL